MFDKKIIGQAAGNVVEFDVRFYGDNSLPTEAMIEIKNGPCFCLNKYQLKHLILCCELALEYVRS